MIDAKAMIMLPPRPEAEAAVAADLRRRVEAALQDVCAVMDDAAGCGLQIVWDSVSAGPALRHQVNNLRVIKTFR